MGLAAAKARRDSQSQLLFQLHSDHPLSLGGFYSLDRRALVKVYVEKFEGGKTSCCAKDTLRVGAVARLIHSFTQNLLALRGKKTAVPRTVISREKLHKTHPTKAWLHRLRIAGLSWERVQVDYTTKNMKGI